eukprot:UN14017
MTSKLKTRKSFIIHRVYIMDSGSNDTPRHFLKIFNIISMILQE